MRASILFALAACAIFALMAATSLSLGADPNEHAATAPVNAPSALRGLTVADLPPPGRCRIWYDIIPTDHQPAPMPCQHALWLAERWGGRVIQVDAQGAREIGDFVGRNDFSGVPADELPRPGYCRAWIDGLARDLQPAESDCREADRIAREQHARVLFMPF